MNPTPVPSQATAWFIAAAALTLALLGPATGCSRGDAGANRAGPLDACSLLSGADVAEVLGIEGPEASVMARGDETSWLSGCNYHGEAAGALRSAGLMVSPHGAAGPQQAFAAMDAELIEALGDDAALEPIEGLGARAGWQDFDTPIGQLIIFDGPYRLTVTASAAHGADQRGNAEQLAKRVLDRLPAR